VQTGGFAPPPLPLQVGRPDRDVRAIGEAVRTGVELAGHPAEAENPAGLLERVTGIQPSS
jgi:hypothetical protein